MHDNGSVQLTASVRLQLQGSIFKEFEDWRRSQSKIPSRSEALRRLLELALSTNPDPRPPWETTTERPSHSTTNSTLPATSPT
jgi:hypothetical protein